MKNLEEKHSPVARKEENHYRDLPRGLLIKLPWASPLVRQVVCHNTILRITI